MAIPITPKLDARPVFAVLSMKAEKLRKHSTDIY